MNLNGTIQVVRLTDVGLRREHNEDAVASDMETGLLVLADGMGGYKAGEVASEMAVLTIVSGLRDGMLELSPGETDATTGLMQESVVLRDAVARANSAIYNVSQSQPQCAGMGTTLVAAVFADNRVGVGHIGDSRLYRLRDGTLAQLTEDHSLLNEQLKAGLITPEQAKVSNNKNLVTRALGVDPEVELELHEHVVEPGDIYLLCSDGLSDLVEDEEIELTLNTLSANLELAAHQLVQMANDNGGKDNISVILARTLKPFPAKNGWRDKLTQWLK
ncbi:PPM family protein phosphatase [Novimethylophilus kurashikiensis]|uniref:PPM family protein phosphatase n=1 Tax=Novimethylophilus kurashikiensis TaxID=1825523 RepID=A0A2R5F4S6_9PROT|nr:Stp1/IreP family PP2C-type Ser/Thr phosphatase [Novimethylophilus kurashikiensis]GBG13387.1 PPM family protein phosphatase [Novimethylophilus kurashikiensis]